METVENQLKWYSAEMKTLEATKFKGYLREHGIPFEPSSMGDGWVHFECYMTEAELEEANLWIKKWLKGV